MKNQECITHNNNLFYNKWIGWISGIAAGIADAIINYPPYGIKLRQQWQQPLGWWVLSPKELYRGITPYSIGIIPATIIQDGVGTFIRSHLSYNTPPLYHALGAMTGGIASSLICAPIEYTVLIQQSKGMQPRDAIQWIYHRYPLTHFWRGLSALIIRDGIYAAATFWGVDEMDSYLKTNYPNKAFPFSSAILVGTMGAFLSHPCDVLKTRMQYHAGLPTYIEMVHMISNENGFHGFYRGFPARWISTITGVFLMSKTSSITKKYLHRLFDTTVTEDETSIENTSNASYKP